MKISRRFNHTGRRRIKRSEVEINLREGKTVPEFDTIFRLARSELPMDASLLVEAYHKNTSQRFDYGTVGAPITPTSTRLTDIDLSGPVLFRVKVVDDNGRLLAAANSLRPANDDEEDSRASLMTFKATSLGQLPWRVDFPEDAKPVLCINNKIPEAKGKILGDPLFQALILPGAFREVLLYVLLKLGKDEPDESSWEELWLNFAEGIAPGDRPDDVDEVACKNWIDDVVREFSERHELCSLLTGHLEAH